MEYYLLFLISVSLIFLLLLHISLLLFRLSTTFSALLIMHINLSEIIPLLEDDPVRVINSSIARRGPASRLNTAGHCNYLSHLFCLPWHYGEILYFNCRLVAHCARSDGVAWMTTNTNEIEHPTRHYRPLTDSSDLPLSLRAPKRNRCPTASEG